jgi:thioredoxin 1
MASVVKLTDQNFDAEVTKAQGTVLVDFGAAWCGPCKQLDPIVTELAGEFDGRAKLCKVDIGESQKVAVRYQIMSVPTIIIFRNGRPAAQINGLAPKKDIARAISENL